MTPNEFIRVRTDEVDVVDLGSKQIDIEADTPVWLFRVDLDIDNRGNLSFEYDKAALETVDNQREFDQLMADVADYAAPKWKRPRMSQHGKTPFSINCTEACFIVMVLHPGRNWQFSNNNPPFKIIDGKETYYWNASRVNRNGAVLQGDGDCTGCRVAFFYAEGHRDQADYGDEDGNFESPFNIYLDFLLHWQGKDLVLPITVDPDVGHPGGSFP